MAKDREIEQIEAMGSELDVNSYTIQYDPKVKRFFKGFAPKLAGGGLISTAVFAGLGIATLVTGGIAGLGIGAIVGASVAVGASVQSVYSGIVYGRNASTRRFEKLGIGGQEDNIGTIGIIEEYEERAHKYTQLLEEHSSQRKFTLEDGATYSRMDLKRRIKESEDIAYHGLKYILKQGVEISENINALRKKVNLTQREEDKLEQYWDIMARIGACVEKVSTSRENFNPYKVLVVDAIRKGCLLGNDYQNNQIRAVATKGEKDKALDLYSNMYEQKVLKRIKKQRQEVLDQEQLIEQDKQQFVDTKKEVIAKDRQIDKVKRNNRKLAKQINELDSYSLLIDVASRLVISLPQAMESDRKALGKATSEFKTAIEINDANEIKTKKDALDSLVEDTQERLYAWYTATGKKAGLEKFQQQFEEYKAVSEQALAKRTQQRDEAIQRAWNQRGKNRELTSQNEDLKQRLDFAENDLEMAAQGWYEAEGRAEEATKRAEEAEAKTKKAKKAIRKSRKQTQRAIEIAQDLIEERDFIRRRAEEAEDTVSALYDNFTQAEQDLEYAQNDLDVATQGWYEAEGRVDKARKQTAVARRKAAVAKTQAKTARAELETVKQQRDEANVALLEAEKGAEKTFKELHTAKKKNGLLSRMIASLLARNEANEATIERLAEDVEYSRDVAYNENLARKNAEEEVEYAQGVAYDEHVGRTGADDARAREVKAHKSTKSKLAKETKRADKAETELDKANQTIGNLGEEINNLVTAQGENIDRIAELEVENERLKSAHAEVSQERDQTAQLATQLGSDLYKVAKELEYITGERDSYVEAYNATKETIEAKEDEIVKVEAEYQTRFYNMLWQGAYNRLDKIVKKAETHARITAIERKHVDSCADAVMGYVETVRKQDLEAKTVDELKELSSTFTSIYKASKLGLTKIDTKELNKIIAKIEKAKKAHGKGPDHTK